MELIKTTLYVKNLFIGGIVLTHAVLMELIKIDLNGWKKVYGSMDMIIKLQEK